MDAVGSSAVKVSMVQSNIQLGEKGSQTYVVTKISHKLRRSRVTVWMPTETAVRITPQRPASTHAHSYPLLAAYSGVFGNSPCAMRLAMASRTITSSPRSLYPSKLRAGFVS